MHITGSNSVQWTPIKGFETRYELSSSGDVRVVATGKLLAKRVVGNNESVLLYNGSKHAGYTIAKLLESHFGISRKVSSEVSNLDGEEWREVPGFEGLYWISSKGRIKSRNAGVRDKELLVKPTNHIKGGYSVSLHKNIELTH
ncbi:NUMOD4 domain-containing protein [Endozoicomonas sp.]|uniref:NUMOD4 domain-containing protein n=1 Tax=Endozoicomonas sp. TaxID=1892382 RepID=UPI003AF96643